MPYDFRKLLTMNSLKRLLLILLGLAWATFSGATDSLTVGQCRELALKNSPLQQKKLVAESIAALQLRSIESNALPRINFSGQATWQNDVFGLPFSFPGTDFPKIPKDQYKLAADVSERLYDGGSDGILRRQRALESQLAAAQVEVDVFQLRELVTDLFFKTLLLQETENVLLTSKTDFENRLKQADAQVKEGVALRTTADQIRIQILKTQQQLTAAQADRAALLETLAKWLGRTSADFALATPKINTQNQVLPIAQRPEYQLFELQKKQLALSQDALKLKTSPKVEVFAQGGLGRPSPLNFFKTSWEPFVILGLRAAWSPIDWGNAGRERQVLDLQMKNVATQQAAFDQRLDASLVRDRSDFAKLEEQMRQDDSIIALQEDIIRRADAQVKNGVMTTTDYLDQVNLLTQDRLAKATHQVQFWQAWENWKAKMGAN